MASKLVKARREVFNHLEAQKNMEQDRHGNFLFFVATSNLPHRYHFKKNVVRLERKVGQEWFLVKSYLLTAVIHCIDLMIIA